MASIQQLIGDGREVEATWQKCVETAEKMYPQHKGTKPEDVSKLFMWQNNLLKFYLDYNVDQACDYGNDLLNDLQDRLPELDLVDLKFSTATALSLQGSQLNEAESLYETALEKLTGPNQKNHMKPFLLNNLGVTHFYQFIEKSTQITNQQAGSEKGALDKIGEILQHFDKGVRNLKTSVREFESFDDRFKDLEVNAAPNATDQSQDVSMERVKQKIFIDEFFDPLAKEILPKDGLKSYDIKNHPYNEKFLQSLFLKGESILPIQNLGEMAYIIQKYQESFALLDVALKLYKVGQGDPSNTLKYKVLSLLGSLLDTQNDAQSVQKINQTIFKQLEHDDCYEKVFALRNYGYLLARNEETRHEGKDYIEQAEKLETRFPYWSERKMNLFVPVMGIVMDETSGIY